MNDKLIAVGLFMLCLSLSTVASISHATGKSQKTAVQQEQIQPDNKVNLNTASAKQIASAFNGIGDKRANAIVTYRQKNGAFKSISDLSKVKGISKNLVKNKLLELQKAFTLID